MDPGMNLPCIALLAVNALFYGKVVMYYSSSALQLAFIGVYVVCLAGMAALLASVGNKFTERKPDIQGWARVMALAQIPMLASIIPLVGGLLSMWGLLTGLTAIRGAGGTSWGKAIVSGLIGGVAIGIAYSIVVFVLFWLL